MHSADSVPCFSADTQTKCGEILSGFFGRAGTRQYATAAWKAAPHAGWPRSCALVARIEMLKSVDKGLSGGVWITGLPEASIAMSSSGEFVNAPSSVLKKWHQYHQWV